jgi:tRNA modification GTPase
MNHHTIAAIATPVGSGGIGIVKLSGPSALQIAQSVFRKKSTSIGTTIKSHRIILGNIVDSDNEQVIDEVLMVFMKSPYSYTREDVVEIQSHANPIVMKRILEVVLKAGAKLSQPGEFTRRAFLNGRIDLTQAEATIDLINAKSQFATEAAANQINGVLLDTIKRLRHELLSIIALIEVRIEFPEEDEGEGVEFYTDLYHRIEKKFIPQIERLILDAENGRLLKDGVRLAIAGRPNVGKSSLMNQLLSKDRAIVTQYPGTTRDIIEELFYIKGIPYLIADTAGLRKSKDPVEILGIEKAIEYLKGVDIILFLVEANDPFNSEDRDIYNFIKDKKIIVVANKIDLIKKKASIEIQPPNKQVPMVLISALNGNGLDELKKKIEDATLDGINLGEARRIIPNLRQSEHLKKCLRKMNQSKTQLIEKNLPDEIIVFSMKDAYEELGKIIGAVLDDDLLDHIFNNFCIGK